MQKQKKERSLFHKTINGVIITAIAFFVLFALFFGFSQTSTFRNYLKNIIAENVNSSINGKLSIERIDGSIFTSIKMKQIVLESPFDTLCRIEKLEVHLSPLHLLLKKIFVSKIIIEGLKFNYLEVSPGTWNLASLSKAADSVSVLKDSLDTPVEESEASSFPFIIQVNDLSITDLSFILQNFENSGSTATYNTANYNDIRINDFQLKSKALIDIGSNDYQIVIQKLAFATNINGFNLQNLSGAYHITDKYASLQKMNLKTDNSDLEMNVNLEGINIFGDIDLNGFKDFPTDISLNAKVFDFADLKKFVDATDILNGSLSLNFSGQGTFGDLNINKLHLDFNETAINLTGKVQNLNSPGNLFFDLVVNDSKANFADVNTLLPMLQLNEYDSFGIDKFNLTYKGRPDKFNSTFMGVFGQSELSFDSQLDFSKPETEYDIKFKTTKLDASIFTGTTTLINSTGTLKGKGIDPSKLNADLNFSAVKSNFNGYSLDSLKMAVNAKAKVVQLDLAGIINSAKTKVDGKLDLTDQSSPVYDLNGNFRNLDISKFIEDSSFVSSLNFNFLTTGRDLDLDKITGKFILDFEPSTLKKAYFEDAKVELNFSKEDKHRDIKLTSNFVDMNISGDFSLKDAVDVLAYQSSQNANIISNKIKELNPAEYAADTTDSLATIEIDTSKTNIDLSFDFDFEFKDFALIATIMNEENFGIAGKGGGSVSNNKNNFDINCSLDFNYLYTLTDDEILYLSNLESTLNFSRDNRSNSFNNLLGALSISSDRIVTGSMIKNFTADFVFNQSKLIYNVYTEIDTSLTSVFEGFLLMEPGDQMLTIEDVKVNYKDVIWSNREPLMLGFSQDSVFFNKFTIYNDESFIEAKGLFTFRGQNNLDIYADRIPGGLLSYYTTGVFSKTFSANTSFNARYTGLRKNPKIDFEFRINDITFNNRRIGHLICEAGYQDKYTNVDFKFIDSTYNINQPYFRLAGQLPINMAPQAAESFVDSTKSLYLKFAANDFDIATLGDLVPTISNQKGFLSGDIELTGTFDDINYDGSLNLNNATFLSDINNLEYRAGAKIEFDKNVISIDSLAISNLKGSRLFGTMSGDGFVKLAGFTPDEIELSFDGGLAVLGKRSRSVSPAIYGNLYIEAKDTWKYSYKNGKNKFTGNALLKEADLVFTPIQTGYSSESDILYLFKVDSSKIDLEELKFNKLISTKQKKQSDRSKAQLINFDYSANVEIDREAKIEFILSPSFNQKLIVLASGNILYESIDGQPRAQGEFKLLEGSKLDFIKTLDAQGSIRFETKIADPLLNIVATYNTVYFPPEDSNNGTDIAVKIKINGNFSQLGKSLAGGKDNILVYSGQRNIADNIPDPKYDAVNALSFILIGKPDFKGSDATKTSKLTQSIGLGAAASVLGTALTSLVNSRIGDAINDIQLVRTDESTQFNVSGRFENIRYTVGGTTQDISKGINNANLRIEYLFNPNFLIKIERKEPITSTQSTSVKINELGLKYIFIF